MAQIVRLHTMEEWHGHKCCTTTHLRVSAAPNVDAADMLMLLGVIESIETFHRDATPVCDDEARRRQR